MNDKQAYKLAWHIHDNWMNGNRRQVYAILANLNSQQMFSVMSSLDVIGMTCSSLNTDFCQDVLTNCLILSEDEMEEAKNILDEIQFANIDCVI